MLIIAATSVWSALSDGPSDYDSFVASRGVAGLFAATPQIFISGVITNMFFLHQQGRAFGVYSTIYMIVSLADPSFSGYIVQYTEWPVCFWWTVGANALAAILIFVFGEDTLWDRERKSPVARKPMPET
jgi:MFS family permease